MKTIIALYLNYNPAYLEFVPISTRSLLRIGGVPPGDVYLFVAEQLSVAPEIDAVNRMGVNVLALPGWGAKSKYDLAAGAFRLRPDAGTVLMLDVDTCLTQPCRLQEIIHQQLGDAAEIATYRYEHPNPGVIVKSRAFLWGRDFQPDTVAGEHHADKMVGGFFGTSIRELRTAISDCSWWYYGGYLIISRRMVERPIFKAMVGASYICGCDETVLALARLSTHHSPPRFMELAQKEFAHRVCPEPLELEPNSGPGMAHFAAKPYRDRFKSTITAASKEAMRWAYEQEAR